MVACERLRCADKVLRLTGRSFFTFEDSGGVACRDICVIFIQKERTPSIIIGATHVIAAMPAKQLAAAALQLRGAVRAICAGMSRRGNLDRRRCRCLCRLAVRGNPGRLHTRDYARCSSEKIDGKFAERWDPTTAAIKATKVQQTMRHAAWPR